MQQSAVCLCVLMLARIVSASTAWNPAGNSTYPPASGDWDVATNWTNGLPSAVADGKAQFNRSGAAECVVSNAQSCTLFVQGDNGPGGVIRIIAGGSITTGSNWSAVGYNNTAHMIVEMGGVVTCGQHLWVGSIAPSVGRLDINGGYVRVSEMFGIGWQSGRGNVNVNAGHLDLHSLHATDSIKEGSTVDIAEGVVTIDGNYTSKIEAYVAAGRIMGYAGKGTVHCDYDVTNSGKTTVRAEPPEFGTGDIDGDGDVDTADLSLFAAQWLDAGEELQADLTRDEKVDLRDYSALAANWKTSDKPYYATLHGMIVCGYQGWFNAPGDGANRGWVHWGSSGRFEPGYCTVDWWPDMSEHDADEKFPTGFSHADGSTACVFSSYNRKTVLRHFSWMAQYGIDGVFLQRFVSEATPGSSARNHRDHVMLYCREGANLHKRAWAMMYDLSSSLTGPQLKQRVIDDWKHLVDTYRITRDPADRAYLHHKGKPVVAVWGLGFGRAYEGEDTYDIVNFLKNDPVYGGCTVMIGVQNSWRTNLDYWLQKTVDIADIVSPWAVGRYGSKHTSELDNFTTKYTIPDQAWCNDPVNNKDYLPVVFPGFSWQNLQQNEKFDQIPRRGGDFLWRQVYKAIHDAGAAMI